MTGVSILVEIDIFFQVRSVTVEKDTEILKRLNKTKEERKPDLREEREERDRQERLEKRRKQQEEVKNINSN